MNDRHEKLSRRKVVAGVGTAGALGAVAALLPAAEPAVTEAAKALPTSTEPSGYRETDHVLHYYRTTLV